MGNSRERLVLLETKSNRIERGSSAPSARTRTVLTNDVVQNRTLLEQSIASAYIDYPKHYFPFANYQAWPFSEWVPQAEVIRNRIARGEKPPVLASLKIQPQRPSFLNRFLGRS